MTELTLCKFCDRELEPDEAASQTCDGCYYGMRLDPAGWKRSLKKAGKKKPVQGLGCQHLPLENGGAAIVCYDPYQTAEDAIKTDERQ